MDEFLSPEFIFAKRSIPGGGPSSNAQAAGNSNGKHARYVPQEQQIAADYVRSFATFGIILAPHRFSQRLRFLRVIAMSNTLNSILLLGGRFLLAAIFLMAGIAKVTDWSSTERMMTEHGMIGIPFFLPAAAILEIAGGLALLSGCATRPAALALFLFLIPTTVIFHNFWAYEGLAQQNQMQHFMKNLAIMGGLLELSVAGAGAYAIDALSGSSDWRVPQSRPTF